MTINATDWPTLLHSLAAEALRDTPLALGSTGVDAGAAKAWAKAWAMDFADESGHRRAIDGALLARLLKIDPPPPPPPGRALSPDEDLWWRSARRDARVDDVILAADGPLVGSHRSPTIETWTECELSAMHAAWNILLDAPSASLYARLLAGASWLTTNLQPDNATNHPWAVHAFIHLWNATGDAAFRHYAETLIHNCQVQLGRPDRFSALLLLDAANALSRPAPRFAHAG